MIEFELSAKKSGSGNRNSEVVLKRKSESLRRMYYDMQKGICRDSSILESSDINCLGDLHGEESNLNGYMGDDSYGGPTKQARIFKLKQSARCCEASAEQKNAHKMLPSTCGDRADLREEIGCSHALPDNGTSYKLLGLSPVHSGRSLWKHIDLAPGMPMTVNLEDKVPVVGKAMLPRDTMDCMKCSPTKFDSLHDENMLPDERNCDQIGESAAISDKYLVDISDCLLNFANEDNLVSKDTDSKAANCEGQDVNNEKSDFAGHSSVLNCPDDKNEDNAVISGDARMKEGAISIASQGSDAEKLGTAVGQLGCGHSDQFQLGSLDIDKPLSDTKLSTHFLEEMYEEIIICILNTEDPEIPCNDDFPSPTALFCSTTQPRYNGSISIAFPSANRETKFEEQNVFKKEESKPESASTVYQIKGTCIQAGAGPNYHVVNAGGNFGVSSNQCARVVLKEAIDVQADMDPCRLLAGSPGCTSTLVDKSSATDFPSKAAENSSLCNIPEMDGSPSKVDYEQDESDSHIPNFDDVEAMVNLDDM